MTFNHDRTALFFDAELGTDWYAGSMPLSGEKPELWARFDICYNHAQFSPTDPDMALIAQDGWLHAATGQKHDYTHRMWLLRRDGSCKPIFEHPTPRHGHEWWDASGDRVWYIHYGTGVEYIDLATRKVTCSWEGDISHAHAASDASALIGDHYRKDGSHTMDVLYRRLDWPAGRSLPLALGMPQLGALGRRYHLHAHPRFTLEDELVIFTATHRGYADVALVPTRQLR